MLLRGTASNQRHAKNYIHKEADARLQEVVSPIQQQGKNALGVDWVYIHYYQLVPSNVGCTCREVQMTTHGSRSSVARDPVISDSGNGVDIQIDWKRPLFGTKNENPTVDDNMNEDDLAFVDDDISENPDAIGTTNTLFGASVDCGICFRSGMVPGYKSYGKQRFLFSTHHIDALVGYHIKQSDAPHTLSKLHDEAYVEFTLIVPKYFKQAKQSIWNNKSLLSDKFYSGTKLLTNAYLKQNAGKTILVRILADIFTHGVIEFDLGADLLKANFAQMSKSTDWTMLDTLGQLNIVLPSYVDKVSSGDILYVPTRKQGFKVTDVTYLQTAKNLKLDWQFQVRVLQPQEAMLNASVGSVVF